MSKFRLWKVVLGAVLILAVLALVVNLSSSARAAPLPGEIFIDIDGDRTFNDSVDLGLYDSITNATLDAIPGDVIVIGAGNYSENLVITISNLTIVGPNENIDPNTGVRGPEARIIPPTQEPGPLVDVLADHFTMNGICLNGSNPEVLLNYGVQNGIPITGLAGVSSTGLPLPTNFTFVNNLIQSFDTGIAFDGLSRDSAITHCQFDNIGGLGPYNAAVSLQNNFFANVSSNVMTRVVIGIHYNIYTAGGSLLCYNNTISGTLLGIAMTQANSPFGGLEILQDHVSGTPAGASVGIGIGGMNGTVSTRIDGCVITGLYQGIVCVDNPAGITIAGSTMLTCTYGMTLGEDVFTSTTLSSIYSIQSCVFNGNALVGLWVLDNGTRPGLTIADVYGDSLFTVGGDGIRVEGPEAVLQFLGAGPASFVGVTGQYVVLSNSPRDIDATRALFEGVRGMDLNPTQYAAVEAKITDQLDNSSLGLVYLLSPIVRTTLSDTAITLGFVVSDNATVYGVDLGYSAPTGTMSFQALAPGSAVWLTYDTEPVTASGSDAVASSVDFMPDAAGTWYFRAVYSGDANYSSGLSVNSSEPLVVLKGPTFTLTLLDFSTITLGDVVYDYAAVFSLNGALPTPTGTVDFQVSYNGSAFATYDTETLINGSVLALSYQPLAAGPYNFRAVYSGDSNYNGSMSINDSEPLDVLKAPTFVLTFLDIGGTTQITLGDTVFDYVAVFALNGAIPVPSGTIDFQVSYNNGTWTTYDAGEALVDEITFADTTSTSYLPLAAGHYDFRAIYSGDSNYNGSMSINDSEPLEVLKAPTSVITFLDMVGTTQITLGDMVFDYASVLSSGLLPIPTGTVDFQVSYDNGTWVTYDAGEPLIGGTVTSISYQPLVAGHYDFRAIYSGDANFTGSTSINDSEPLEVLRAPTFVLTFLDMAGTTQITLGDTIFDYANVFGLNGALAVPTGTVDFQVSYNGSAFATFDTETLVNGSVLSLLYQPLAAGHYEFQAVYSGDSNYNTSTSVNGSEPLDVLKAPTFVLTLLDSNVITLGYTITDFASVFSNGALPTPTGTVDFQVSFSNGTYVSYDVQPLVDGSAASVAFMPLAAGHYEFLAIYSGDSNFNSSTSLDLSEPLDVIKGPSFTTTLLDASTITLGDTVLDYAQVVALNGALPVPTGNVTFLVSFNGSAFVAYDTEILVNGTAYAQPYQPLAPGHYEFQAVYSGDVNFNVSESINDSEPLDVLTAETFVLTLLDANNVTLGDSITDFGQVIALNGALPLPTGTIAFQVSYNGGPFVTYDTEVLVGGSATSIAYQPLAAGHYEFLAVYGGDSLFSGSTSINGSEPLDVQKAPTFTFTLLDATTITLGDTVLDYAQVVALNGALPVPTGTIDFQVSYNGGPFVTYDTEGLINGSAYALLYQPLAPGHYELQAVYSGDSNYNASVSVNGSEPLDVLKAPAFVVTLLSSNWISLGQSVTDLATVFSLNGALPMPTGTVDFFVSLDNGTFVLFDAAVPLVNGTAVSTSYLPIEEGHYEFQAVYNGDSNFNASTSINGSEPLRVSPGAPGSVITALSDQAIALGVTVYDTATVYGFIGGFTPPTGYVLFQYLAPGSIVWVTYDNETLVPVDHNSTATSIGFVPNVTGTWYFRAVYSGDADYTAAMSVNDSEPLAVFKAPTFTLTLLDMTTITLGDSVTDYASVFALSGLLPTPTGSVEFQVSYNGSAFVTYDTEPLIGGVATAIPYQPLLAGHYEFLAVYGGDSIFNGSTSINGSEPLDVLKAPTMVLTLLSSGTISLGGSITDYAQVIALNGALPIPTGTVEFQVSFNGSAFVTYDTQTLLLGEATSAAYMPSAVGHYEFQAVYSGDSNFNSSTSLELSEPLDVLTGASTTTTLLEASTINFGDTVVDTAHVAASNASLPVPTGTVEFQVSYDGGSYGTYDTQTLVGGSATSIAYLPLSAGHYEFRAVYSGDSNYDPSTSADLSEPLTVIKAASITTTMLNATEVNFRIPVVDNATVSAVSAGLPASPTGTVEFQVSFDGGSYVTYDNETLVDGFATAVDYLPHAAGHYEFRAVYSGDVNFNGSTSPVFSEPLDVLPIIIVYPGQSIQDAIDEAAPGFTIIVLDGNFTEELVIGIDLTLIGAGADPTNLISPDPSVSGYIILVNNGATVTITGFHIMGPANGLIGGIGVFEGANVTIIGNSITDIRHDAFDGDPNVFGVQIGNSGLLTYGTAQIVLNNFSACQGEAIRVDGIGSSAEITSNLIVGDGPSVGDTIVQKGIHVLNGATAGITDNDISNIGGTIGGNGIFVEAGAHDVQISGGILTGLSLIGDTATGILFFNAGLGGYVGEVLLTGWPNAVYIIDTTGVDIENSTLQDNLGVAIILDGAANTIILYNDILDNGVMGIAELGSSPGSIANFNNIAGNAVGAGNAMPDVLDARYNWWGNVSGPGGDAPGSGDGLRMDVADNIIWKPWLREPYPPAELIFGNGTKKLITEGDPLDDTTNGLYVAMTGAGNVTVGALRYDSNPEDEFGGIDAGIYVDVHLEDPVGVTQIEIRVYFDAGLLPPDVEVGDLGMFFWNGEAWIACSDSGVNMDQSYVWALIRADTLPTLAFITGTPFLLGTPIGNVFPSEGPAGTHIYMTGSGLAPDSSVTLFFEDQPIAYGMTNSTGDANVSAVIPFSLAGDYQLRLVDAFGNTAYGEFKVLDDMPISVTIDVGSLHFAGEIVDFWMLTSVHGVPVNVNITTLDLYGPDGSVQNLSGNATLMVDGLYRIRFVLPIDAVPGEYTLFAQVRFGELEFGSQIRTFLVSDTLTGWNARLISIQGNISLIQTSIGLIQVDISDIQATLEDIEGDLVVLDTNIGIITTTLEAINATLALIQGDIATIQTDIGTIQADVADIDAVLTNISGDIATIVTDIGTIQLDISNINATLVNIEDDIATIETDIGQIQVDVANINATLVSIEGDIATIQTDIGQIQVDVASIDATLVSVQDGIATIQTDIGTITATLDDIEATLEGIQGDVAFINTTVGELAVSCAEIGAKITEIQGTLVTIQTEIGTILVNISVIDGRLTNIEGSIATIETDIGLILANCADISARVTAISGTVAYINTTVGAITVNVNAINARVITINDTVATILTQIGLCQAKLDAINAKLVALNGTLATIVTTLGRIEVKIDAINTTVIEIKNDIATIMTSLGQLQGRVTALEGDVATINTEIGNLTIDVSKLKTDTTTTDGNNAIVLGAMAAAIAAIFAILGYAFFKRS